MLKQKMIFKKGNVKMLELEVRLKAEDKKIDVEIVDFEARVVESWVDGELCEFSFDEVEFPNVTDLELICQLKSDRNLKHPTELKEGEYYKVSLLNLSNQDLAIKVGEETVVELLECVNIFEKLG